MLCAHGGNPSVYDWRVAGLLVVGRAAEVLSGFQIQLQELFGVGKCLALLGHDVRLRYEVF